MDFEFDATKSRTHQLKHGIDFNKAQALWDDYNYIELPARTQGEPRWLVGRDVRFDEGETSQLTSTWTRLVDQHVNNDV